MCHVFPRNEGNENQEIGQKWLCAVSTNVTSVTSEHLLTGIYFQGPGLTITSRRARLYDDHVEMLTWIHNNLENMPEKR